MSLWTWAGQAWERPGFAEAWIKLQDETGQCVPLLLWAAWLAERGRTPDSDAIETASLFCRDAMTTILPLRDARRGVAPAKRGDLLQQEIEAEQVLMDHLETITLSNAEPFVEAAITLSAISARWGPPLDPSVFIGLLEEPADVG